MKEATASPKEHRRVNPVAIEPVTERRTSGRFSRLGNELTVRELEPTGVKKRKDDVAFGVDETRAREPAERKTPAMRGINHAERYRSSGETGK